MRNRLLYLCRYLPWLALLLVVDAVSALLLWLSEAEAFGALIPLIMLGTVLLFSVTALVLSRVEQKRENAFRAFLNNPDLINEENLIRSVSASDRENVRLLGTVLREKDAVCSRAKASAEDYEEYVEAWAHETKNPLSLLTMVLDNQGDEIPASAAFKLEYVRSRLQEYISQILYYARLKSGRKDYLFEHVDLNDCISEVLEDDRSKRSTGQDRQDQRQARRIRGQGQRTRRRLRVDPRICRRPVRRGAEEGRRGGRSDSPSPPGRLARGNRRVRSDSARGLRGFRDVDRELIRLLDRRTRSAAIRVPGSAVSQVVSPGQRRLAALSAEQ